VIADARKIIVAWRDIANIVDYSFAVGNHPLGFSASSCITELRFGDRLQDQPTHIVFPEYVRD
jgi:hypothetical protein